MIFHVTAGKGVLNVLNGVLPKWYLQFYRYDSVALTLGCKLDSFHHLHLLLYFQDVISNFDLQLFKRFLNFEHGHMAVFTAWCSYASAICLSVRPSVRHTLAL